MNEQAPRTYPEYKLELTWRADADGNGIKTRLYLNDEILQASFHPTLDLLEAVESAMTNYEEMNK